MLTAGGWREEKGGFEVLQCCAIFFFCVGALVGECPAVNNWTLDKQLTPDPIALVATFQLAHVSVNVVTVLSQSQDTHQLTLDPIATPLQHQPHTHTLTHRMTRVASDTLDCIHGDVL